MYIDQADEQRNKFYIGIHVRNTFDPNGFVHCNVFNVPWEGEVCQCHSFIAQYGTKKGFFNTYFLYSYKITNL